jgi:GxxExxY protein
MPITLPIQTERISQAEFGVHAYDVLNEVFAIHADFGRFLHEKFYKLELAARMDGIALEVPITVTFRDFSKQYFLDVLKSSGGLFEFKSVDAIHARHRGQTLNYLLLSDLAHAKIINVRPERVEHEFVNCNIQLADLRAPKFILQNWDDRIAGAQPFHETLRLLIEDWGSGLELELYSAALSHFLCGTADVSITGSHGTLGVQPMRLAAPYVAFKLTALKERHEAFASHTARLLKHTQLNAILWANITRDEVRCQVIVR